MKLVHDRAFSTDSECLEFFQALLNTYGAGEVVSERDHPYLLSLLTNYHPCAAKKIGCGIKNFRVERDPVWKRSNYFLIVRVDGSTEDFSYRKCIGSKKYDARSMLLSAMRSDIYSQIRSFRDAAYGGKKYVQCGITGLAVRRRDCHIDHTPPVTFQILVRGFLRNEGLKPHEVIINRVRKDNEVGQFTISDWRVRKAWQDYHAANAVLRVTLDHANLGQKRVKVDLAA